MEQLPVETRTKLRSTQILTSLPQIISELLQNALDSGARQIEIGVDCEEWSCWVRDDGTGMSKEGMSILEKGFEDGRYGTSKAYTPESLDIVSTFGFRGEALASAADLSCLEISSRTSKSRESWSIILKSGKSLYNGPSIRWRRELPGTVVCIRDAFYNLPIRRLSHPPLARTLELIRQEVEGFALVFPHVSFSLENTNKERSSSSKGGHILRIPKTVSSVAAFRHIFGRALVEHVDEISVTSSDLKLDGFISLEGAHSKTHQFMYINKHPVSWCDLHRLIDSRFASSSFSKHAYDETGETSLRSTIRRSPRKSERKPVYVLNLTIPRRDVDNCLEPAKAAVHLQNKDAVSSFLSSVIQSFLVRHGFVSHKTSEQSHTSSDDNPPSPRKRRKVTPNDTELPHHSSIVRNTNITLSVPDHPDSEEDLVIWTDPKTSETFVVDKRTGNSYLQGTLPPGIGDEHNHPCTSQKRRTLNPTPNCSTKTKNSDKERNHNTPEWIQEALQANQAYAPMERRIPAITMPPAAQASDLQKDPLHSCHGHEHQQYDMSRYSQPWHSSLDTSISLRTFIKTDLLNAQVISQVDRKFIACLMDDDTANEHVPGGRALVLIDQHAADERVRVESFLKELCRGSPYLAHNNDSTVVGIQTEQLSPPIPVLLTRREAMRLADSRDIQGAFEAWGVRFANLSQATTETIEEEEHADGYTQVFVNSIPSVVSEKLLQSDELRVLIKGFLAKLETDGLVSALPSEELSTQGNSLDRNDTFFWLKVLRWCPRELLDLVNSKACRGAIMFNDSLTLEQCERLVRQLSDTAFPFQCAHGRPSLVPLMNIGTSQSELQRGHPSKVDWSKWEQRVFVK